ncbi:hypothetical protein LINPERPRIM_LOCUS29368 [Linum perenne]
MDSHFLIIDTEPSTSTMKDQFAMEVAVLTVSSRSLEQIQQPLTFFFNDPSDDFRSTKMKNLDEFEREKVDIYKGCPALIDLREALNGHIVIGYKVSADITWIKNLYSRADMDPPCPRAELDAHDMIYRQLSQIADSPEKYTMESLFEFYKYGRQNHRALSDALALVDMLRFAGSQLLVEQEFLHMGFNRSDKLEETKFSTKQLKKFEKQLKKFKKLIKTQQQVIKEQQQQQQLVISQLQQLRKRKEKRKEKIEKFVKEQQEQQQRISQLLGEESKAEFGERHPISGDSDEGPESLSKMVVVLCEQNLFLPLLRAFEMFLLVLYYLFSKRFREQSTEQILEITAFSQMCLSKASAHLDSFLLG